MSEPHALAERYRTSVEASDRAALAKLYHPDVLFDAHVPNWRFQVQGRDAVVEHTGGLPGPGRFAFFHAEPTAAGDLLVQFEWRQQSGDEESVIRELHLLRLDEDREDRIVEQVMFCAGIWSPQLQTQMAAEAPLIRP